MQISMIHIIISSHPDIYHTDLIDNKFFLYQIQFWIEKYRFFICEKII